MADWIADFMRKSGKSVTARTSMTPQAWLAESPDERQPEGLAHGAARAVAADHEQSLHGLHLSFVRGIEPFEPDGHRIGRRSRAGPTVRS